MQIISLNNHIVRKALCLSLNEMAVLCDIKQMSQNPEYGYTCIKSKDKIADWLDLSRATVFNAIKTLEVKGYIERTNIGIRPTKFIYDLDLSQEEIGIYIQRGDLTFITKKVEILLDGQSKNYTDTVQNLDSDRLKIRLSPSKIYTQDTHRDTHLEKKEEIHNGQDGIEVKKQKFVTPTIREISEYLKAKHPIVSQDRVDAFATKFWSHYENKNWSYGRGQKMKDWRLAFGQWQETIAKDLYQSGNTPTKPAPPRKAKVKYFDTDFPDRVKVATREEFDLLVSGDPSSTYKIVYEYFD